tara:strand:+ start:481 stop:666 length:186 start_codon:yes stop_codon:yes gene_type:complete
MNTGTVTKRKNGDYELLVGMLDLGSLGKAPNVVTGSGKPYKKFESESEAKKWWEENKHLFK